MQIKILEEKYYKKYENFLLKFDESLFYYSVKYKNFLLVKDSKIKFDNEMQCYPYVFNTSLGKFMVYNGNNFGKKGFGLAVLEQ